MMHIDADFQSSRKRLYSAAVGLTLVAALACAAAIWEYSSTAAAYNQAQEVLSLAQRKAKQETAQPGFSETRVAAINRAIQRLNLPWSELFSMFERNQSKAVVLLALEPDVASGILKIQAEAKTPEDMVDFVEMLEDEDIFTSVSLIRHEIFEPDPNKPYRFAVEAQWSEGI